MDYLMTSLKLITHATSCSPKYQKVALDTCSYGYAQFMGIAMDSILFQEVKAEKILLHHCTKYCNEMPDHIYYDFACQLSEYFLNREPELFKNTRFWHDLFHFVGHVCGINFKSGRVLGFEGVNTEICEQVNSFLQCIK